MLLNRIHWLATTMLILAVIHLFIQAIPDSAISTASPITQEEISALVEAAVLARDRENGKKAFSKKEQEYQLASTDSFDSLKYGTNSARITLQVFSDIECPMCRKMHPVLKQIVDSSQGVINWEYRHFPLSRHNPSAAIESQAIECIRESYNNRTAWIALDVFFLETRGNGKGIESIADLSRDYGLSGTLIENCLASDSHKEKINGDYELGRTLGVSATPALRIIDNQTQKSILVKGYKTPEQILMSIKGLIE